MTRAALYTATVERFAESRADDHDAVAGVQEIAARFSLPVPQVIRDVLRAYMHHHGTIPFGEDLDLAEVWAHAAEDPQPVRPPHRGRR